MSSSGLFHPLNTIADTLEARAEAQDPLAPAEMLGLAEQIRSLAFRAAPLGRGGEVVLLRPRVPPTGGDAA